MDIASIRNKYTSQDNALKKLMRTAGIVLFGNTGASVLNFATFTIVVNQLGAKIFAIFVLAQTYVMIINGIFNIQTWESTVKFGHAKGTGNNVRDVVQFNFVLDLCGAIVAFVCAVALVKPSVAFFNWDPLIADLIVLYSLTLPVNLTSFTIGIPRMFDKFSEVARLQICVAVLKLLLVVGAMSLKAGITSYMAIYLATDVFYSVTLISYSAYLLKVNGYGGWLRRRLKTDKQQSIFIWWTNLRYIMRIPVQYCDMIIISMVMPLETVGLYKVYKEIAGLLNKIGDPINQALFPEYAKMVGANKSERAATLAKKIMVLLFCLSAALSTIMIVFSSFFVGKLYGVEFLSSINAMYLLIFFFGVSLFTIPIDSLFVAAGFVKSGFHIVVFTNIMYLFVAFFLGKELGIYGIIMAYGTQLLVNKGLKIILLRRYNAGWSNIIR